MKLTHRPFERGVGIVCHNTYKKLASIFGETSRYVKKSANSKFMTFSEFERVLNHCAHLTKFWLFLRVGEFCLFVLLTSTTTNSLLAKVLTLASSFFVPFVAESQGFTEICPLNRESQKWTYLRVF